MNQKPKKTSLIIKIEGIKMNNQSPLIPQGIFPEQKNQTRARVKIAVFVVLAIHGVGLLALLLQGCNKPADTTTTQTAQTNESAPPQFTEPTNLPPPSSNQPSAQPAQASPEQPVTPAAPSATDYKIAAGDSFSTLAKKFHVSVKAIEDANPGVVATRLQIGQTIHIPAPTAPTMAAGVSSATPSAMASNAEQIYTVKSGDTLTSIAHDYKTTIRALRSANDLKTDSIKVGQKLKIPSKPAIAPAETPPAPSGTTSSPTATPPGR
jgi:LysM repeat protein